MEINFIRGTVFGILLAIVIVAYVRAKQGCFFELQFREDIPAEVREKVRAEIKAKGIGIGGAWKWKQRIEELMEEYKNRKKEMMGKWLKKEDVIYVI